MMFVHSMMQLKLAINATTIKQNIGIVYMSNKDGTNGQGFLGNYGSASNGGQFNFMGIILSLQ